MTRFIVSFLIANVIGAIFLYLAWSGLPTDEVEQYFEQASTTHLLTWCAIYVGVYIICHGARIVRWYDLVRPLGEVDGKLVHRVCVVGFTAILLLPLRLGELVRPYLLSRRTPFSMSAVLGTAVVERVIDGLIITGLLFVTLATYSGEQSTAFAYTTGALSAGIFSGALVTCLLALWRKDWTIAMVEKIFGIVSVGLARKLSGLLEGFIDGFRALIEARSLGRFLLLTAVYWGSNVVSMWLLARYGFELDLGLWEMTTVLALLVIGIMIPAGPAMAGNFEFFLSRALGLFVALGTLGAQVAAFAATVHVLQFVVIVSPGILVMWFDPESRNLIQLSEQAAAQAE